MPLFAFSPLRIPSKNQLLDSLISLLSATTLLFKDRIVMHRTIPSKKQLMGTEGIEPPSAGLEPDILPLNDAPDLYIELPEVF
jgi:hypothetical protein